VQLGHHVWDLGKEIKKNFFLKEYLIKQTIKFRKIINQMRVHDFLFEQVFLVQKEDHR
jgi:hypothetical protein